MKHKMHLTGEILKQISVNVQVRGQNIISDANNIDLEGDMGKFIKMH